MAPRSRVDMSCARRRLTTGGRYQSNTRHRTKKAKADLGLSSVRSILRLRIGWRSTSTILASLGLNETHSRRCDSSASGLLEAMPLITPGCGLERASLFAAHGKVIGPRWSIAPDW